MKLYDITHALAVIHQQLDDAGGELTVDLEAELDRVQMAMTEKIEHLGRWVANLGAREDVLDIEIDRLRAKRDQQTRLRDRLKEYVKTSMEHAGCAKLEYDLFTVRVQKNPPSLDILDATKIPARFLTIIPATTEPNRKAIVEALKQHESVEGTQLITNKTHLRII